MGLNYKNVFAVHIIGLHNYGHIFMQDIGDKRTLLCQSANHVECLKIFYFITSDTSMVLICE